MFRPRSLLAVLTLSTIVACADHDPPPTSPADARPEATASMPGTTSAARHERLERVAQRLARALRDPVLRARLKRDLDSSTVPEHKLHFQRLLAAGGGRFRHEVARLTDDADSAVDSEATGSASLELYFPVPAHRAAWQGDTNLLVATVEQDHETPVAFDLSGRRVILDPDHPPTTPVLALVPVESDFDQPRGAARQQCNVDACGGGGGGTAPAATPGLYMTYAHFTQTFEGWLKGDPEFEVHLMGQAGTSDSLVSYQCAGEHAGGPYTWDQNTLSWSGSVLLFSQAQLDGYRKAHPNQNFRVVVLEDDDTACGIRVDADRFTRFINVIQAQYPGVTGTKDTVTGLAKSVKRANALQKILSAAYSLITTQDDLIGNAIEDAVVGQYYPGANWIVKGENNITNGWIKLEMK